MDRYCKRLIEVDLPIKRISAHSRREKSIRHGHISTLHIWWARRPLAACRAVICASLWPDPADELCPEFFRKEARALLQNWALNHLDLVSEESWSRFVSIQKDIKKIHDNKVLRLVLLDFIADFANWDNSSIPEFLELSQSLTLAAHTALGGEPNTKPLIVDPFAGGGSIPLEALRIGANAFASDLNPVAVILNKAILEYIPKYGFALLNEFKKWGAWIKTEAGKRLDDLYPYDEDKSKPVAYLWARKIRCEGPNCGTEIPLLRSLLLAKRGKKSVALRIVPPTQLKRIDFEVIENVNIEKVGQGTVKRSAAICPLCGYTTSAPNVRKQFSGRKGGANDAVLLAVVVKDKSGNRKYRKGNNRDIEIVKHAAEKLNKSILNNEGPYDKVLTEELPYLRSIFNINLLDVNEWQHLFTARQMFSLTTLWQLLREKIMEEKGNKDMGLINACATCLALAIDRVAAQCTSLSWWQSNGEFVVGTFGRQALGIIWDFAEIRPVSGASGDLDGALDWVRRVIANLASIELNPGQVEFASAVSHPLPDDSVDIMFTDPPYYDAVPYADLSDFFYIQIKRMLYDVHPDLFTGKLSPKEGEIVQLAERNIKYSYKTKKYFEQNMINALSEGRRFSKPEGVGIVVFAHKTTEGWEAMLSSLIEAGWIATASWPIDTERSARMRANKSAALGSSVHIVVRPRENPDGSIITNAIGDWRDILCELPRRLHEWMPRLAEEGVVGADAIFACIGPALEIFSRYSSVEKANGEKVALKAYLEEVWAAIAREALTMIFEGADASGFEEDARLTAMWLWTLRTENGKNEKIEDSGDEQAKGLRGYSLEYDAARKIAQGLGAHLENLSHLIEVKGNTATLLTAGARTRYLFGKDAAYVPKGRKKKPDKQMKLNFEEELKELEEEPGDWTIDFSGGAGSTVLDQLHQCMVLFGAGRGEALRRFLVDDAIGHNPLFWRLAQALSALYPAGTNEKRWVDGVLARKKGLDL